MDIKATVFKHGNSQAITLSTEALYKTGFDIGDKLDCHVEHGKIICIKKGITSFKEQIQNFYRNGGSYKESEIFEDNPVGKESW